MGVRVSFASALECLRDVSTCLERFLKTSSQDLLRIPANQDTVNARRDGTGPMIQLEFIQYSFKKKKNERNSFTL